MLPASVQDAYFAEWKASQAQNRQDVEDTFAPLPIVDVPLFRKEIVGMESLADMAAAVYEDRDPTDIQYRGRVQTTEQTGDEYLLKLRLPFTEKEDVHLLAAGDELVVRVGSQKRNVILPRALVGLPTKGARFEDGVLVIRFAKKEVARGSSDGR